MTKQSESRFPQLEITPAQPDEEAILANLLQLYAHDFSDFHDVELGEDGRFCYKDLPLYWRAPNRYPFLFRTNGKLAGFALVSRGAGVFNRETVWDMAEFFVVRAYRRHGVGTEVAHRIWRRFPGLWEIRVMESNRSAHLFWERAVATFAGKTIHSVCTQNDGKSWRVFSFEM